MTDPDSIMLKTLPPGGQYVVSTAENRKEPITHSHIDFNKYGFERLSIFLFVGMISSLNLKFTDAIISMMQNHILMNIISTFLYIIHLGLTMMLYMHT